MVSVRVTAGQLSVLVVSLFEPVGREGGREGGREEGEGGREGRTSR